MKLSKDSSVIRLYKWFYNTESLPSNLCPYFWKLVLMWILIVPYFIFVLPSFIIERLSNEQFSFTNVERRSYSVLTYMGMLIIFSMGVFIYSFFNQILETDNLFGFKFLGGGFLIVLILALLSRGVYLLYKKITYKPYIPYSERIPKKDSIIKEFFKAKKEKYCPKIDWE